MSSINGTAEKYLLYVNQAINLVIRCFSKVPNATLFSQIATNHLSYLNMLKIPISTLRNFPGFCFRISQIFIVEMMAKKRFTLYVSATDNCITDEGFLAFAQTLEYQTAYIAENMMSSGVGLMRLCLQVCCSRQNTWFWCFQVIIILIIIIIKNNLYSAVNMTRAKDKGALQK